MTVDTTARVKKTTYFINKKGFGMLIQKETKSDCNDETYEKIKKKIIDVLEDKL